MPTPKVLLLMGATATGKTDLALEISRHFEVEIISVDSALIYRGMDIGTAKPETESLQSVPHHLIDIIDPAESYSVWDFLQQSRQLVDEINARGHIPLLAGGTMMYCHAFEHGLNRLPEADEAVRRQLELEAEQVGWQAMHAKLAEVDAVAAGRIKPTDTQRIQRGLEVYQLSGVPLSQLQQQKAAQYPGQIEKIILAANDRSALHRRIELRFHDMLERGFLEEVKNLRSRSDLDLSLPSMRCVGYRQLWQHLDGDLSYQEMTDKGIAATRQLAKRQLTWLRKQSSRNTFDCLNYRKDDIFDLIKAAFSSL